MKIQYYLVLLFLFSLPIQASELNEIYGKIIHADKKNTHLAGKKTVEFTFRIRNIHRKTGSSQPLMTLKGRCKSNSALEKQLNELLHHPYAVFKIYKRGYRWLILDAYPLDIKITPKNKAINIQSNKPREVILVLDNKYFNRYKTEIQKKHSLLQGESGIQIGN